MRVLEHEDIDDMELGEMLVGELAAVLADKSSSSVSGVGLKSLPIVIVGNPLIPGNGGVGGGGNIPGWSIPNRKKPPLSNPGVQKKHEGPPLMNGYRPIG